MTLPVPFPPPPLGELLIVHPSVQRRLCRHWNESLPLTDSPSSVLLLYLTLTAIFHTGLFVFLSFQLD